MAGKAADTEINNAKTNGLNFLYIIYVLSFILTKKEAL